MIGDHGSPYHRHRQPKRKNHHHRRSRSRLIRDGKRVLAIDLDRQASLSISLGLGPKQIKELDAARQTIYFALVKGRPLKGMIVEEPLRHSRPDLVPASIRLSAAETELISPYGAAHILRDRIEDGPRETREEAGRWRGEPDATVRHRVCGADVATCYVDYAGSISPLAFAAPTAGQMLLGNSGGTAFAVVSMAGDCTIAASGSVTYTKTNGDAFRNGRDRQHGHVWRCAGASERRSYLLWF